MAQHKYQAFCRLFSVNRLLRKIEEQEREGWELVCIQPVPCFIFGAGGWLGQTAFMRKPVAPDPQTVSQ